MDRPACEQALVSLLPSITGPIPSLLINHAVSILAQSRSKAASLKPDEEIARSYACAHLACERLKQQLNLPPIQPRPPVPARIYKKVYTYFSSVITEKSMQSHKRPTSVPGTPKGKSRASQDLTPSRGRAGRSVGSTKVVNSPQKTPLKGTPTRPQNGTKRIQTATPTMKRSLQPDEHAPVPDDDMEVEDVSDEADDLEDSPKRNAPYGARQQSSLQDREINLRSGLGTMFVESVDWLSEDKRKRYADWKSNIQARIQEIERQ